jgi:hypothetical protein
MNKNREERGGRAGELVAAFMEDIPPMGAIKTFVGRQMMALARRNRYTPKTPAAPLIKQ